LQQDSKAGCSTPAERRNSARQSLERIERQSPSEKYVDARTAEAGSVQAFQFLVADTGVYDSHTPPPAAATESSVRRLSVPYTGWDGYGVRDTQRSEHSAICDEAALGLRSEGILFYRLPEDMRVAVPSL
jgi:hypothetical protein